MIILIASTKGGAGKSTVATNLAVSLAAEGRDVLLVDADKQATSRKWHSRRPEDLVQVHIAQVSGNTTRALKDYAARYDCVVVDAGGAATPELASAAAIADLVLIPIRPSIADIDALHDLLEVLETAAGINERMEVRALVNAASTNYRVTEAEEALAFLAETAQIETVGVLRERKAFRDAMVEGKGVSELPANSAAAEFAGLFNALQSVLTSPK